jgi:hypothetical protein
LTKLVHLDQEAKVEEDIEVEEVEGVDPETKVDDHLEMVDKEGIPEDIRTIER